MTTKRKTSKKVALSNWKQTLRPYQQEALDKALAVKRGGTLLLSAPTGTGKGTMQLGLLVALRKAGKKAWIVTPSLEVLRGYLERCGAGPEILDGGTGSLAKAGEAIFCTTPIRMRNKLRSGKRKVPDVMLIDEAHHATLDTIAGGGLRELCPTTTWIGFTATPYRGNPEETAELLKAWNEPHHVLTIPQAIENGAWALPKWRVEPLIDDDKCQLTGGDLDADEVTTDAAPMLADFISTLELSLPSCVTVGSVKAANALRAALEAKGVETLLVIGDTPTTERAAAYERCSRGGALLISVKVLGEGVDLPWLRRWIDASPTLSPVCFLQKLGRITRPHASGQPEYVGTNRNLERHGYLLAGSLPKIVIREAQERFGGGTRRKSKKLGMIKGVTKLKPIELPLSGGGKAVMYACWCPATLGGSGFERCLILDDENDHAFSAVRDVDPSKTEPEERWGPWRRERTIPKEVVGFKASRLGGAATVAQRRAWDKDAENRGLDGSKSPTRAQYFALPVLAALKTSIRPDGSTLRPEKEKKVAAPVVAAPVLEAPKVLDGYFTIVRAEGHETYRIQTMPADSYFAPGRQVLGRLMGPENTADYQNKAFLVGMTVSAWSRFAGEQSALQAALDLIAGDSAGAGKAYALRSGRCWRCTRMLTTPNSIFSGIGPECADKLGLDRAAAPRPLVQDEDEPLPADTLSSGAAHGPKHETASEGNIPLMVRLIREMKDSAEIEAIYVARYASEGKDVRFARERVRIYTKIARKQIAKEERAARLASLGF